MNPDIQNIQDKTLIGIHLKMNLIENKTRQLWQSFSPRIPEIQNKASTDKYSLQMYPQGYFKQYNPQSDFIKWAAVEVSQTSHVPPGMKVLTLQGGMYAVFHYQGTSADRSIFQFIYSKWVPNSKYDLDNRPHFEVLGENYKNNDAASREDIYIPIIPKSI